MIIRIFGKITLVCLLAAITFGCQKEDLGSGDNTSINNWIYNSFSEDYLWRTEMRARDDAPTDSYPTSYFTSVIKNSNDKYSYCTQLTSAAQMGRGVSAQTAIRDNDFGFKECFISAHGSNNVEQFAILFVVPDSPADKAGLKRGDYVWRVNSTPLPMSDSQYNTLLMENKITLEVNDDHRVVTLTRFSYLNNPVLYDRVLNVDGIKVGYLVYSHFSAGNGALSDKLNEAFARLKAGGITDLILDLRYNSGGEIAECRHLASLIVPRTMLFDTFVYQENARNVGNPQNFVRTYFMQPALVDRYSVGARRLFILTSSATASASEIIMHALKPYYGENMKIFGNTSAGKNVGGIRVISADGRWAVNKITVRIYNKNKVSGYEQGIEPDYDVSEGLPTANFGNAEQDKVLRKVFEKIYGKTFDVSPHPHNKMIDNDLTCKYTLEEPWLLMDCLKK